MFQGPTYRTTPAFPLPFTAGAGPGSFAGAAARFFRDPPASSPGARRDVAPGNMPYIGHCVVPVDCDGSMRLPGFVRRNLERTGTRLFVGIHETSACLIGSTICWGKRMSEAQGRDRQEKALASPGADTLRLFGLRDEYCRPDGAIRLPSAARALAGIEDEALVVGAGRSFEIWALEAALQSSDPVIAALGRGAVTQRARRGG